MKIYLTFPVIVKEWKKGFLSIGRRKCFLLVWELGKGDKKDDSELSKSKPFPIPVLASPVVQAPAYVCSHSASTMTNSQALQFSTYVSTESSGLHHPLSTDILFPCSVVPSPSHPSVVFLIGLSSRDHHLFISHLPCQHLCSTGQRQRVLLKSLLISSLEEGSVNTYYISSAPAFTTPDWESLVSLDAEHIVYFPNCPCHSLRHPLNTAIQRVLAKELDR